MRNVWAVADSIVSPLGLTSRENYERVREGVSGIRRITQPALLEKPFYAAMMETLPPHETETRFERLCSLALEDALAPMNLPADRTLFILSTTKGNIDQAETVPPHPRLHLHATAQYLAGKYGFRHHHVVSNACISGVLALITGKRWIESGAYDHAVIVGADVLSAFVLSGFQSLHALSAGLCKPFDAQRDGINLGEAAAAMVLSALPGNTGATARFRLRHGSVSNDANHISGPSRTGAELAQAIGLALHASGLSASDIDFISAHGTATPYNDEMEAKAFHLAGLANVPLNSLKGYFGHTLGAAGVVETIISLKSLEQNERIPTLGYAAPGVTMPVNVVKQRAPQPMKTLLKTASGFGGCNAALVIEKENN